MENIYHVPGMTEEQRRIRAENYAAHLPMSNGLQWSEDDIAAAKAAFMERFNEELPRTETLMAVAMIGYRMAVRDLSK